MTPRSAAHHPPLPAMSVCPSCRLRLSLAPAAPGVLGLRARLQDPDELRIDLTESLALGFQAWHQAPPPPKGTWRVGQGGTCPLPSVGSQGEFRVWAWQLIPPGAGMRLLILCPSKPGFSLGSWWCLLTGVTGSQGSYVCLALLCPAGSKPQHTVCHLIDPVAGNGFEPFADRSPSQPATEG